LFLNKILLNTLSEKEQQGALLEANLLRQLDHAHIVSYKSSFIEKGVLIIVMEYWEVGDLSYHIKKKKAKNEYFTEDEILNWFIQIAISLEYIHGRKVIHRDIKTSNIFLTGNNTVKLGDFGISRVLESTNEAAMTVVGTPYYMSPEVWESKPYTFKSDVWALGWVLYELWTLQHAFLADNLLGLVFKIVKGNYDNIPSVYSSDMKNLVDLILNKDASKRPTVQEILLSPFLKAKMEEFILNGGELGNADLKVRKIITEKTAEEKEKDLLKGLTGSAYLKKKKEIHAQKEADKITQAIRKNASGYGAAKERKYNEFYSSKGNEEIQKDLEYTNHSTPKYYGGSSKANQFKIDPNSASSFGVNDRYEDTYELSNSMGTQISQLTEQPAPMGSKKFSNYNFEEEREIKGSGSYKFEEEKEDEYQDDFEEATKDAGQLTGVLDNYKRILSGDIANYGEKPLKREEGEFSPISEAPSTDEFDPGTMIDLKNAKEKQLLLNYFGEDLYHTMYDYLLEARRNEVSDKVIQTQLQKFVGSDNKEGLSMCFKLDMIAFKDILNN